MKAVAQYVAQMTRIGHVNDTKVMQSSQVTVNIIIAADDAFHLKMSKIPPLGH